MTLDLLAASAGEIVGAIRDGLTSSEEVVGAHLAHIAVVNPTLNAVVQLDPAALANSRAADTAMGAGKPAGPLHGLPFTVKDVLDVAGLPHAAGDPQREKVVPVHDATVVARMRSAGAVLLGKTNTPKHGAGGETDNEMYGATRNPRDPTRSPGGSSGGEAAIIGAGGSPLGIGTDSGGSVRFPAHCCGVAALKPSAGRVPLSGAFPPRGPMLDPRTQAGLLARCAADLALALPVIAGPDGKDSGVAPVPLADPSEVEVPRLRVAFYCEDGVAKTTAETAAALRRCAAFFAEAGCVVEEARPRRLEDAYRITFRVWQREKLSGREIVENAWEWDRLRRAVLEFHEDWDVILCPTSDGPAPRPGELSAHAFAFTLPFSLTGSPAVVIPAASSPEGLPLGIQIVAAPWRDEVALAAAIHLEGLLGTRQVSS